MISNTSPNALDAVKMPRAVLNRLTELACYPASMAKAKLSASSRLHFWGRLARASASLAARVRWQLEGASRAE